jgi:glutaredoxin-related protein
VCSRRASQGGSDILMGMHTSGELAQTLAKLKGKK